MMADKIYKLIFTKDDDSEDVVQFTVPQGESGVYILADEETIADAPADANVVIDPTGTPEIGLTAEQVSAMIDAKLGVIENGAY